MLHYNNNKTKLTFKIKFIIGLIFARLKRRLVIMLYYNIDPNYNKKIKGVLVIE